jgi:hypothetical protein
LNPRNKIGEAVMTLDDFRKSLAAPAPPAGLGAALESLWHDARGEWDLAHQRAQSEEGGNGDWVHAYLHRKEGDTNNAAYWYRRARRAFPIEPLEQEWERIARALLGSSEER